MRCLVGDRYWEDKWNRNALIWEQEWVQACRKIQWCLWEQLINCEEQVAGCNIIKIWGKVCVVEGLPVSPSWLSWIHYSLLAEWLFIWETLAAPWMGGWINLYNKVLRAGDFQGSLQISEEKSGWYIWKFPDPPSSCWKCGGSWCMFHASEISC